MTEEQAWRLFFATGLPEAWLWARQEGHAQPQNALAITGGSSAAGKK